MTDSGLSRLITAEMTIAQLREAAADGRLGSDAVDELTADPRSGVRAIGRSIRRSAERELEERRRLARLLEMEEDLREDGFSLVAGVDEVGVGPLAGPVVAAAVIFPPGVVIAGVDDSKKLDGETRSRLDQEIRSVAIAVATGEASIDEIDRLNIYQAALLAMKRAVQGLSAAPDHLLVDAREIPGLETPQAAIVHGDATCFCIAAASIVAKVHRDRQMVELDLIHPGYGFSSHKGYATKEHQEAIKRLGPTSAHRGSYEFLREVTGELSDVFYEFRDRLERVESVVDVEAVALDLGHCREKLTASEWSKLRTLVLRRRRRFTTRESQTSSQGNLFEDEA